MISESIIAGTYIRPFIRPDGAVSEAILWMNQNEWFMPFMALIGAENAQQFLGDDTPVAFAYLYIAICTLIKYFGFFSLIYYIMLPIKKINRSRC